MIVWFNMFLYEMCRAGYTLVNHEWCRDTEQRMHAVTTLQECCKRCIREMILHLQQMNELGHSAALLNNLFEVQVRISDEFIYGFLVSEDTIFVRFLVLEDTKVGLSWHQKALLNNIYETETEEVQWDMHEIGS